MHGGGFTNVVLPAVQPVLAQPHMRARSCLRHLAKQLTSQSLTTVGFLENTVVPPGCMSNDVQSD